MSPSLVPDITLADAPTGSVGVQWPYTHGVSYRVVSNSDLGPVWAEVSGFESLSGGEAVLPISQSKEFFLVELDDNLAPRFISDPIRKVTAAENGVLYTGQTVATEASDPDAGGTLTFTKLDGPSWLSVASDGALSGTPDVGGADEGANYFTVQVADNHGATIQAKLQLDVVEPTPGGGGTSVNFEPVADTYVRQDESGTKDDDNFGTSTTIELRQEFGHVNNFGRIALLRFDVSGVLGAVQSATLYLTPDTTTGASPAPETSDIAVYDLDNDSWNETSVTWSNTQSPGLFDDIAAVATATLSNSGSGEQSVDVTSLITGNGTFSLVLDEVGNSLGRVYSREATDPAKRPRLEVTYAQ